MYRFRTNIAVLLIAAGLLVFCCAQAEADSHRGYDESAWMQAVAALNARNFSAKAEAAEALFEFEHPQVRVILEAWLDGGLYRRKSDQRIVSVAERDDAFMLHDAAQGHALGRVGRSDVKKITINNRLRKQIRRLLAVLDVRSPDPQARLAAVRQLRAAPDAETLDLLRKAAEDENDSSVLTAITEILALEDLRGGNTQRRLAALEVLKHSLRLEVYNELTALRENPDADKRVAEQARKAADSIKMKRDVYAAAETVFFGISLGSVLVLAAIGLAITFGVMGVINMAHGELIMLGAYTAYVVQQLMPGQAGLALLLAVPLAFLVSGGTGVLLEQGVVRFLYGRPLETLLATFGVSLILQQLVRSIFSPLNRPVTTPDWMSGAWQVNEVLSLTYTRLYLLVFSLSVFFILLFIVKRTSFGLQLRATSQNRRMARAMGVRSSRVDALTFGLGSGIAGIAGVGLSQLTNVGPNMGQSYIIDSFMVIVFGGTGNLWGTLYAGLVLGTVNKMFEPFTGAMLAKIIVLVLIILFIQKRPRGLFPQSGRAADG